MPEVVTILVGMIGYTAGLTAMETEKLWLILKDQAAPYSASDTHRQLDLAIQKVKAERESPCAKN